MLTHLPRRGPCPQPTRPRPAAPRTGTHLRRFVAVLTGVTAALLASVATIPAAFASVEPDPAQTRVVAGSGMPGWQSALIVLGAVLLVTAAAVLLDRALATRRAASAAAASAPAASAPAASAPAGSARAA
jgi:hypothetical protein